MHQINMNWQASSQVLNPRHQHPPQCWEGLRNLHPVTCLETVMNVVICMVVRDLWQANSIPSKPPSPCYLCISICIGYDVEPSRRFPLIAIWEFM